MLTGKLSKLVSDPKDKFSIMDVVGKSIKPAIYFFYWYLSMNIILTSMHDINLGLIYFLNIVKFGTYILIIRFAINLFAFFLWKLAKMVYYHKKEMEDNKSKAVEPTEILKEEK